MSWHKNEGTLEQDLETPGRQPYMPRREIRSNSVTHHRAHSKSIGEARNGTIPERSSVPKYTPTTTAMRC